MIICCYTSINKTWSDTGLSAYLARLPKPMAALILKKRTLLDMQLAIAGKLLLVEVLSKLNMPLLLADIKVDAFQRPYFDADIDFNISHSGNVAVCCATTKGKVGVDVEEMYQVNVHDYDSYFTAKEWAIIDNSGDKADAFFKLWTRKEAVLKAIGTGFSTPLQAIEVVDDDASYKNKIYHLSEIKIEDGYQCQLAATTKQQLEIYPIAI